MFAYIIRRSLYAIPIVLGVNILLFALFFVVYSPDQIARQMLGEKNVTPAKIERWKREHNYHLPTFFNTGFDRLTVAANRADATITRSVKEKAPDGSTRTFTFDLHGTLLFQSGLNASGTGDYRVRIHHLRGPTTGELRVQVMAGDDPQPIAMTDEPRATDGALVAVGSAVRLMVEKTTGDGFWLHVPATGTGRVVVNVASIDADQPDSARHTDARIEVELFEVNQLSAGERLTRTIFWQKGMQLLWFDFGKSDASNIPINYEIRQRMMPSLQITVPMFLIGLVVNVFFAMMLAFYRATYVDHWGTVLCVLGMSTSIMFFIVAGQLALGVWLKWVPVSGFGIASENMNILGINFVLAEAKFLILPVMIGVVAGAGSSIRLYRTFFLEEINKDYIRTARAKGLPESKVLFKHGLKNAMIPILTSVVMTIPFLFMGNLLLENFYSIPGLGSFLIEAINQRDFAIVRAMVFLGSVLYVIALVLTDISYTVVDPRIRFS